MRKDFRDTRLHNHIKQVPPGACNCVDCQKARLYSVQMAHRNAPFSRGFESTINSHNSHQVVPNENFDLNDLELKATELLGKALGNPIAVSSAQAAQQVKKAVAKEVQSVKDGKGTTWTNLPKDGSVPDISAESMAPTGVTINWGYWLGPVKWFFILLAIAVIGGIFLRAKG